MLTEDDFKLDIEDSILYMECDVCPLSEISNFEVIYRQSTRFDHTKNMTVLTGSYVHIVVSNKDGKNRMYQQFPYPDKDVESLDKSEIKTYQRYISKQIYLSSMTVQKPEKLLLK